MYYTIDGLRMFVDERGAAQPEVILFVHGFPFDHSMWTNQMAVFSAHYHCIAPDLRGHGGTSAVVPNDNQSMTLDRMAGDLLALLDQLAPRKPVTLCGLSMGGYIAFAMWRRQPGRFARLVLADTKATPDTPEVLARRQAQADTVKAEGAKAISTSMITGLLARQHRDDVIGVSVRRMIESTSAQGIIATLHALAGRPDSTQTLATIDIPTLVIVGEKDQTTPPADAHYMVERLPANPRFIMIPQAGHLSPLENPAAFNTALSDFLAGS